MLFGSQNPRELGFYFALAQVGLEMVVPMGVGLYLDYQLEWSPWGLIVGTIFGFVGGLVHLISLVEKHDQDERKGKNKDNSDEG
jgi:F0F1-type ATP synthase assembly protein I